MNDILPGQGGAFEIGKDGEVKRVEGTQDAPAPLPPTSTHVDEPQKKQPRGLAAVKTADEQNKGNA